MTYDQNTEFGFSFYLLPDMSEDERERAIAHMSWLLRTFVSAISGCYDRGARRRTQACSMVENAIAQVKPQLSKAEYNELINGLMDDATGECVWR